MPARAVAPPTPITPETALSSDATPPAASPYTASTRRSNSAARTPSTANPYSAASSRRSENASAAPADSDASAKTPNPPPNTFSNRSNGSLSRPVQSQFKSTGSTRQRNTSLTSALPDISREVLNYYQIDSEFPTQWPDRDNDSDESDDDRSHQRKVSQASTLSVKQKSSRRVSRFSPLDSRTNYKSNMSSKDTGAGSGNIVQKDEEDPLGLASSVISALRQRRINVDDDVKLRNRFMLSSTTFSPTLFLSQAHQNASAQDLLRGLQYLSRSIEKKSASLKILVESNFERFVKAKATIDNVYTEMRMQPTTDQTGPTAAGPKPGQNRVSSKGQTHFRNASNNSNVPPAQIEIRKTALTKETEYGVQGIKIPLNELVLRTEEVWGPAMEGKKKGEGMKSASTFIEKNRELFQLGSNIENSIRKQDYNGLVQDYTTAKKYADSARSIYKKAGDSVSQLTEEQIYKIVATGRMWYDVDQQIKDFRKTALRQLSQVDVSGDATLMPGEDKRNTHSELIAVLLQVNTQENPIWIWLTSWHTRLADEISKQTERGRLDLEILRRKLAARGPPSDASITTHLKSAASGVTDPLRYKPDATQVMQFWETLDKLFQNLLEIKSGLLGDVKDFWDGARSFIDGKAQKELPNSVWSSDGSRQHLYMTAEQIKQLQSFASELIFSLREAVAIVFLDPPIDDISEIFSPVPITPASQVAPPTPSDKLKIMGFKPDELPPQTPLIGEAWEKYAFWPPYTNALSGSKHLSKILAIIGSASSDAASMSVLRNDPRGIESLKTVVASARERCVQAICAAWKTDVQRCNLLEDWTRDKDRKELTNMPARFMAFEESVLADLQRTVYLTDAVSRSSSNDIIAAPPQKLLQTLQENFVQGIYDALEGLLSQLPEFSGVITSTQRRISLEAIDAITLHGESQGISGKPAPTSDDVQLLLTLSNLKCLRRETVPHLITQFESSFTPLPTDIKTNIFERLSKMESDVFSKFVTPSTTILRTLIIDGFTMPDWLPTTDRPTNASPYVYHVLLHLVFVHSQVHSCTPSLLKSILESLFESIATSLTDAVSQRETYTLSSLMQATMDIELIAQTLNLYTTPAASEAQSKAYMILDERTKAEDREMLQNELPEMKGNLKRLREKTKSQFGCFRRERKERARPSAVKQASAMEEVQA